MPKLSDLIHKLPNGWKPKEETEMPQKMVSKRKKIIYSTDSAFDNAQRELVEKRREERKERRNGKMEEWRKIKNVLPPIPEQNEEKQNKLAVYGIKGRIISIPMGGANKRK